MSRTFFEGRSFHTLPTGLWWLDPQQLIDGAILSGGWEPVTTAAVRRLAKPGMTAIDAGANIGWFTVLLSRLVGPSGRVLAFEPMSEAFMVLEEHVHLNGLTNVQTGAIALDQEDAVHEALFNYSWEPQGVTVAQHVEPLRCRTLDGLLDGKQVDFVKVDTDGFETRLLRGAAQTIRRCHPVLVIEVCEYTLRSVAEAPYGPRCYRPRDARYGKATREMLALLTAEGYRFLREDTFEPQTVDEMLTERDLTKTGINAIAVPDGWSA